MAVNRDGDSAPVPGFTTGGLAGDFVGEPRVFEVALRDTLVREMGATERVRAVRGVRGGT